MLYVCNRDVSPVITEEGGELEVWREMKDQTECNSPSILIGVITSLGKTSNISRKEQKITIDHLNHLIHHLNHLIHHIDHLIHHLNHLIHHINQDLHWTKLQGFLQRWQNNTEFCKHHRKLEANPSVEDDNEVFHSSSVLVTNSQVEIVFLLVSYH